MKRKLELSDLKNYIDTNIKIYSKSESDVGIHPPSICSINQIGLLSKNMYCWSREHGNVLVKIEDAQLILRPMSDLIKPMIHPSIAGGAEFIPLVEIAKLLNPYSGAYELGRWNSDSYKGTWQENSVNKYSNGKHYESVKAFDECAYEYYYLTHFDENNYIQRLNREGYCENIMFPVVIKLLDKLHFDYNDLISQGLAIDINTINK